MNRYFTLALLITSFSHAAASSTFIEGKDWAKGSDILLGGVIKPHFGLNSTLGTSTADPADLAVGHHDPNRSGLTIQNIEMGATLLASEKLSFFGTYAAIIDTDDQWLGLMEEFYVQAKEIPLGMDGLELRLGRFQNRFGFQNALHPHRYTFVNRDLVNARMLGEDSLRTEGAELAWLIPGGIQWSGGISLSYGRVFLEEEAHEEEEDDVGADYVAEEGLFARNLLSLDARLNYHYNDFYQYAGILSFLAGENFYSRQTQAYSLGLEYLWKENGLEAGGDYLRARVEGIYRSVGAANASTNRRGSFDEFGLSTAVTCGFGEKLETAIGAAYLQSTEVAGLEQRLRISPLVQWNFARNLNLRLQYDWDQTGGKSDEHSVWMQFNFAWGSH